MKVSDQLHAPAALFPGKYFFTNRIEGCVEHKASLDSFGKDLSPLSGFEPQTDKLST
jgi:hypothetical protein